MCHYFIIRQANNHKTQHYSIENDNLFDRTYNINQKSTQYNNGSSNEDNCRKVHESPLVVLFTDTITSTDSQIILWSKLFDKQEICQAVGFLARSSIHGICIDAAAAVGTETFFYQ